MVGLENLHHLAAGFEHVRSSWVSVSQCFQSGVGFVCWSMSHFVPIKVGKEPQWARMDGMIDTNEQLRLKLGLVSSEALHEGQ